MSRPDPADPSLVVRTYLEMRDPAALRGAALSDPAVRFERADPCPTSLYRTLYQDVGEAYHWRDRLAWSDDALADHLARPGVEVWVLRVGGERAGYAELVRHDDGSVEIAYFGLRSGFHGRGLGKHLLTATVRRAWASGASRVWLHTCTLDGPAALPNYVARGFTPYRTESYTVDLDAPA
jgi:GNAT superfamily N-acetyltransferase